MLKFRALPTQSSEASVLCVLDEVLMVCQRLSALDRSCMQGIWSVLVSRKKLPHRSNENGLSRPYRAPERREVVEKVLFDRLAQSLWQMDEIVRSEHGGVSRSISLSRGKSERQGLRIGVKSNVLGFTNTEGCIVNKPVQPKSTQLTADKVSAALSDADAVVERHASKSLASSAFSRTSGLKTRSMRATHLSSVERELAELKKVVAALAVRSVAHEEMAFDLDLYGVTVLDAGTAHQLLDTPPEPTEALQKLLALR